MTRSAEPHMLAHFFEFYFIHLDSQRNGQPKFQLEKPNYSTTKWQQQKINLYSDNMENKLLQALINYRPLVITYKCGPLPRCNLHHQVLHEQVNPLLGKFCFPGPSCDQGKVKNMIANHSSNVRQTNVHIIRLLGSANTKPRFSNSSCFEDHDQMLPRLAPSFIMKEELRFCKQFTHCVYCTLYCGILTDSVTYYELFIRHHVTEVAYCKCSWSKPFSST